MQWLRRMLKCVQKRIQKLYINFDIIDFSYEKKNDVKFKIQKLYQRQKIVDDSIRLVQKYDSKIFSYHNQLWKIWKCKLNLFVELDLKILIIDIHYVDNIDDMKLIYMFKCRLSRCEVKILSNQKLYSKFFNWKLLTYTMLDLLKITKFEKFFEKSYSCFN